MKPLPIAVLISGGGTTLENLIEHQRRHGLPLDFRLVISSRADVRGLELAHDAQIPTSVIRRKDFETAEQHRDELFAAVRQSGAQWVAMGGYIEHVLIPDDFVNRVLNIHPSLVPAFCGKGYYGLRVHQAVVEYGVKLTGCTVHLVDNEYDHGPIVAQRACEVFPDDSPIDVQHRVFQLERDLYPRVWRAIAEGGIEVRGRQVRLAAWPPSAAC
ncbi:MAG: phosphoribosylglycinamide formyltransferase [Pirellulaceae bacterium]|nr:MAG: phosphoribosylglycinamide formyltransferase [Pirellulaceae bacterium]